MGWMRGCDLTGPCPHPPHPTAQRPRALLCVQMNLTRLSHLSRSKWCENLSVQNREDLNPNSLKQQMCEPICWVYCSLSEWWLCECIALFSDSSQENPSQGAGAPHFRGDFCLGSHLQAVITNWNDLYNNQILSSHRDPAQERSQSNILSGS